MLDHKTRFFDALGSGWQSNPVIVESNRHRRRFDPKAFNRLLRRQIRDNGGRRFVLTTDKIAYGAYTAMTVTNLQSLAIDTSDPFAGWQSARVDNQTATLADDYEIFAHLPTAATAPANDSAVYFYVVPWITTDGGTTWTAGGNFGTTTLPTGTEGTASISDPNSMRGPIALPYKVTSQIIQGFFTIGQLCGGIVPDGWSLAFRNNSGAALVTACVVAYRGITYTNQ